MWAQPSQTEGKKVPSRPSQTGGEEKQNHHHLLKARKTVEDEWDSKFESMERTMEQNEKTIASVEVR